MPICAGPYFISAATMRVTSDGDSAATPPAGGGFAPCGEMKPQPCTLAFEKPLLLSMWHSGVPSLRSTPGHGGHGAYGGGPGRLHLPG